MFVFSGAEKSRCRLRNGCNKRGRFCCFSFHFRSVLESNELSHFVTLHAGAKRAIIERSDFLARFSVNDFWGFVITRRIRTIFPIPDALLYSRSSRRNLKPFINPIAERYTTSAVSLGQKIPKAPSQIVQTPSPPILGRSLHLNYCIPLIKTHHPPAYTLSLRHPNVAKHFRRCKKLIWIVRCAGKNKRRVSAWRDSLFAVDIWLENYFFNSLITITPQNQQRIS